jgi:hypothetical protein
LIIKKYHFREEKHFLLIVVFEKLFNSQIYGHQGSILGGISTLLAALPTPSLPASLLTSDFQTAQLVTVPLFCQPAISLRPPAMFKG